MRSGTSRFLTGVACFVSIVSLRLSAQTPPPTQAAPSTAAQPAPEPEGWAALEPGQGFQVAKTEKGDLWISASGLFRYLNQLPADQTFVDHLGRERTIDTRNDVQWHRVQAFLNVKVNAQLIDVDGSPVNSVFGYYVGGQRGQTLAVDFSVLF